MTLEDSVESATLLTTVLVCGIRKLMIQNQFSSTGCELPQDDVILPATPLKGIALDWEYDIRTIFSDSRVRDFIRPSTLDSEVTDSPKKIDLKDCLNLFTSEEKLTSDNKW